MKRLLRIFLTFSFLFLVSGVGAQQPPKYENWKCVGEKSRLCFDDSPFLANNVVIEYQDADGKAALLIWWIHERSKEHFTMHGPVKSYRVERAPHYFYERSGGQWILLGTKDFVRDKSPLGKPLELFEKDSSFGKKYFELQKNNGKEEGQIKIPTTIFLP